MLFAEASERLQIVQAVLTSISTVVVAWLAYKTVQLQTQATIQGQRMKEVAQGLVEVKAVTDGITERLVKVAEEKGHEQGRREEIQKAAENPPS